MLANVILVACALIPGQTVPPKVAILPWCFRDGTETAVKTGKETLSLIFEKTKHEVLSPVVVKSAWEQDLGMPAFPESAAGHDTYPALPTAKELLALGKKLNADFVCAGRASWHTKSVWVGLGPKTKADCAVDMTIVDVKKEEIALDARDVKADSTKKDNGASVAAALVVSMGFTALSGGPKTPHQQRAVQQAIGKAMDPWLKTISASGRKIGD